MKRLFLAAALLCVGVANAATLYVTEFKGSPPLSVYYQAGQPPAVASQIIAITGTSAQSAAFNTLTGLIRVATDTACVIEIGGTNPTAVTASAFLPAGAVEYFVVLPGAKIAVKTP
jgi:hypothetical protein